MADANRKAALRDIVDRLPLAVRQREIALRNIETASSDDVEEILDLHRELREAMPAARAAMEMIRAEEATQVPHRVEATGPASPKVQTSVRTRHARKARFSKSSDDAVETARFMLEGGRRRKRHKTAFDADPIARNLAAHIRNRKIVLKDPEADRFLDDFGHEWRVARYAGEIRGHRCEAFFKAPVAKPVVNKALIRNIRRYRFHTRRHIQPVMKPVEQLLAVVIDGKVYETAAAREPKGRLDFTDYASADVASLIEATKL